MTPSEKGLPGSGGHHVLWWSVKVACGAMLIVSLFFGFIYNLDSWFESPTRLSQFLVIIGGLSAIYHYLQLKSLNQNIEKPKVMETRYGLYKLVRHPMYLSDVVSYTGLYLLFPTGLTLAVLMFGLIALVQQSKAEDRFLAENFSDQFKTWEKRSKLLIPFVY